jgi:hypothetical protein
VRLWRNNVGALRDERGRLVTYGLCKGSSDLIGLHQVPRAEGCGRSSDCSFRWWNAAAATAVWPGARQKPRGC